MAQSLSRYHRYSAIGYSLFAGRVIGEQVRAVAAREQA
jgi:hypothetical protein